MKKVTLVVLGMLMMILTYSQSFDRVVRASKCEWRGSDWVTVSTSRPTDYFVIIKDWEITIGTSKFRTYGDVEKSNYDQHVTFTWNCINANGVKCFFMMKKSKLSTNIHSLYSIVYPETGVMYEYETE